MVPVFVYIGTHCVDQWTEYETYHKDDSKIEELNEAIQVNNQNIQNLTNEITQLQNQIKNEEEAKAALEEKKRQLKRIQV